MEIYLQPYDWSSGALCPDRQEYEYQHMAGHRLVQYALKRSFGLEQAAYTYSSGGKPYISGHPEIQFNLSHTKGILACAVSDRPVGIDVEGIRPVLPSVLRKMTERERAYILSADDQAEAFMRVWTMKEACIKMTGQGLAAFGNVECIPDQPSEGMLYRQFVWQNQYVVTAAVQSMAVEGKYKIM